MLVALASRCTMSPRCSSSGRGSPEGRSAETRAQHADRLVPDDSERPPEDYLADVDESRPGRARPARRDKRYLSLYLLCASGGRYLAERCADRLPKASIGLSCLRFTRL